MSEYRYELWRDIQLPLGGDDKGTVAFCMLNPSTADAYTDDPTIRRCKSFASSWGYGKLAVVNLYPYRATQPADLWAWVTGGGTVGPMRENKRYLDHILGGADLCVAAWGLHGYRTPEAHDLLNTFTWHALGLTLAGAPRHPLYVAANTKPRRLVHQGKWVLA